MLLAVRISNYGCTWEVWRALKKLELLSAAPGATLTLLSCSPNFLRASITRYTHAKHEPILKYAIVYYKIWINNDCLFCRVWNVHTGEMLNTLIHHCEAVLHLRFQEGMMVTCSKVP